MKLLKIKNIKIRKEKINVYDITVKDNHNFFANGVLVHNCHDYATKRLLPMISKEFKYKIGLSATIERMDNMHWELLKIFDYNRFNYTPKEALLEGVLNPFNFYNIAVEMDDKSREEYDYLSQEINAIIRAGGSYGKIMRTNSGLKYKMLSVMNTRKQLVNNYKRKFQVVKEIIEKHIKDKVIIFNQYNEQTNKLYWHLMDIGANCRIIHSGINKDKREQNLIDFRNNIFNVLLTSKVLDQGYNLPALDVGVIMAGDSTPKQTIQRMGRVLRKKDKKSTLYQIYVKDTIEDTQAFERANLFKELSIDYNDYFYKLDSDGVFEN